MVPGSTLDHVIFFADDGTAYTMRDQRSAGQLRLRRADREVLQARRPGARSSPPSRPTSASSRARSSRQQGRPAGPVPAGRRPQQGLTLRTPLAPFRTASTKLGRRYVRLERGRQGRDGRGAAGDEESIFLASRTGHVIHFAIDEINILVRRRQGRDRHQAGGRRRVPGRRPHRAARAKCCRSRRPAARRWSSPAGTTPSRAAARASRRSSARRFVRVVPPPIELVDWDEIEGKPSEKNGKGGQATLFE